MQVDVLQRAAADQLANQASLQALIAREADLKAKANQKASAARGPRVRWRYYTDFVPDPGGVVPADDAVPDAAVGPSTSAQVPCVMGVKEQNRAGESYARVGRCTLAFVEMTPDTVPPVYRRQTLNSVLRPPKDMCVKADGTMQQRVRRLTPQEKAQTAGEASASGVASATLSSQQGSDTAVAGSVEDRMLGAVGGAVTGKLRQQYGEMSRVVESVDGYQGMQATAAQHIASMCAPDSMRGMHGGATACVGMQDQGGAHVAGGMDADMPINGHTGAFPGNSIGGMNVNNLGSPIDARWQNDSVVAEGLQGVWFGSSGDMPAVPSDTSGRGKGGKGKATKAGRGKGRKDGDKSTTLHAVVAASQPVAASRHSAAVAGLAQGMYAGHAHAPMCGSQAHMHVGNVSQGPAAAAGSVGGACMQTQHSHQGGAPNTTAQLWQLNSQPLGVHPGSNHVSRDARQGGAGCADVRMPHSSSVDPLGVAGMYGKIDASMESEALASDRLVGNGARNGHHAPLGDLNAGVGVSLGEAPAHHGQLPRNGFHPPNGSRY